MVIAVPTAAITAAITPVFIQRDWRAALPPATPAFAEAKPISRLPAETNPDAVALAKALSRKRPKGGQLSLRAVSAEMAKQGHLNDHGRPFNHKSIASILAARAL